MKKFLFALVLLSSVHSFGQKLELSLKGGFVINNLGHSYFEGSVEKSPGFAGSLSATIGVGSGFRVGAAVSAYRIFYSAIVVDEPPPGYVPRRSYYKYGDPVIPIEGIILKRIAVPKVNIDLGPTVGLCVNSKVTTSYENAASYTKKSKRPWLTLGLVIGAQYEVSKRFAFGVEVQPKVLDGATLLLPVMLKLVVRG